MATLVLSAAGMAIGGMMQSTVLGLSMATIGRAAGAAIGRRIDQSLLGAGSAPVEQGKIDRLRLTGASEGAPLQQVYGRMRVGGQIFWASRFQEHVHTSGGGKGAPPSPKISAHSYSVSVAVALCPGVITRVGRVWADGTEVARERLNMRVYSGAADQQPDPKMEAVEGAGNVPGYQGLAYVVFEDLDITQFGNRVPQFSFEVHRPAQPNEAQPGDLSSHVRAVAMIPGTGEYALATSAVALNAGFGEERVVNTNSVSEQTDFVAATQSLIEEAPNTKSVSLVVSWFGDDLRCGHCGIRPMVEQKDSESDAMPWQVAGISRETAQRVPYQEGRAVYGGTPSDASVIEAIRHLKSEGREVLFYPFILMDQLAGNARPNPWSPDTEQPALPWRGRITTALAPGQSGSSDGTSAARAEVAAFFEGTEGMRRFILHYAQLCADAGGVDAFCIGSEMRGVTEIRDDQGYPAVDQLRRLAADVRAILGPSCKISYAADWSEYHGHQPGNGDKLFHLDPLWADANIDFIGIDNYMPLSDWRDGDDHADAKWGAIWNLDYLRANIAGGEMFDWYYHSPEARDAQIRTPITDGLGEAWIWRQKDLVSWWSQPHYNRVGGTRSDVPTAWQPGSKPIWFTELGCAAIDKGTNQPNKFLDPKSSESSLPYYSNGARDDYLQMQYLRAMSAHYADPAHNPTDATTGVRMVDMARAHVWAWDARPWPSFPRAQELWSDGVNYDKGHWLNGRVSARSLASVVTEICHGAGVRNIDTSGLHGVVRGYTHATTDTAREALQPLMLAYGFDVVEREGTLVFASRTGQPVRDLSAQDFALSEQGTALAEQSRSAEAEVAGRVRIGFLDADAAYDVRAAESVLPDTRTEGVSGQELPLALTSGEGAAIAARWLAESRLARDRLKFSLPPSARDLRAGSVVRYDGADWRIDAVEAAGVLNCEAVRVDRGLYQMPEVEGVAPKPPVTPQVAPVAALFMDLPLLDERDSPHAPHLALTARPWPGTVMMQVADQDADYSVLETQSAPAFVGVTETELRRASPGVWDRGPALRVRMLQGDLQSVSPERLLYGQNLAAIGDGSAARWELLQFAGAELVAPRTYDLSFRLRGQMGSDCMIPDVWPVGSKFVMLNRRVRPITMAPALRGVARDYRWGPSARPQGDATWRHARLAFRGEGLRPLSVCHLRASRQSDGHHIRWTRRTRIDGDSWDGYDVPLGEETERYQLRVLREGQLLTQLETTEPRWHHANPPPSYVVEVAQISGRYGPGPSTRLTVGA